MGHSCTQLDSRLPVVNFYISLFFTVLPRWLNGKEFACKAGDPGSIPGLGKFPGERNGNPLQYSCLGNLMDRGVWRAKVHGIGKESDTTELFNNNNKPRKRT